MDSKIHKYYPRWQDGIVAARAYLKNHSKHYSILVEQNRNLGDTLHLTPIIRHYRNKHPKATIVFVVAQPYGNIHEYNPHIDKLFLIPSLEPTYRVSLRRELLKYTEINKVIAPSIFPYGAVWKGLAWSRPNIADQYFHNAGITDLKLDGGRKLVVQCDKADTTFAQKFILKHKLKPKLTCALEYNSYSTRPKWSYAQFATFVTHMKNHGIKCTSICGPKEKPIAGTIPAVGISWRQTAALLSEVGCFVGSGSGITMIAAAAKNPPHIFEVGIPKSVSMAGCQYAPSDPISGADTLTAAKMVSLVMRTKK